MTASFYFYDLETSGINPRDARIMQFAGQRTDMDLNPIGEPHNILIKMTNDIVPEPEAIMITGITPQQTLQDGITEAEFLKIFAREIAIPNTIFVGFNTVRFDDEFMRYLHYRNFYDPYEWQWTDGKSRWDLLDVVRMTRALRPDGIKWPVDETGKAVNRLELLTQVNGISHESAHDALSDVHASISLAKLLNLKQPKIFDYLLSVRKKEKVAEVVQASQPFVYTSGKYSHESEKTSVVVHLADNPNRSGAALVYDLRFDPEPFAKMTPEQLAEAWRWNPDETAVRLPVKTLQFNRCPAIAPISVLDESSQQRIKLTKAEYEANLKKLTSVKKELSTKVLAALKIMDDQQEKTPRQGSDDVEAQLYDSFLNNADKPLMSAVRAAEAEELTTLSADFKDKRLNELLPRYKVRNFPTAVDDETRVTWEAYRYKRLMAGEQNSRLAQYFAKLAEMAKQPDLSDNKRFLLEELQLYGESIVPVAD